MHTEKLNGRARVEIIKNFMTGISQCGYRQIGCKMMNVIKTTQKKALNQQIAEAIGESLKEIKRFKDKILFKEVCLEMVEYLNEKYNFNVDIDFLNEEIIGTPEERCVYLLRETERQNFTGKRKSLTEIAEVLGCSRRVLEKDLKKMTEQGFRVCKEIT